jgi:TolB-like protein/tetratricopeptide (TPR) repeat protein
VLVRGDTPSGAQSMNTFFAELRRRNLFRVAGIYAVVGWLLAQITSLAANSFGAPDWVMKMIIVVLAIGFPIALLLAWAFEMTPEGVKRTEAVEKGKSVSAKTGRVMDYVILAGLILVAALVIWQGTRSPLSPFEAAKNAAPQDEVIDSTNSNPHPEGRVQRASKDGNTNSDAALDRSKSIAVLPFEDFSQDKDQEWFSDGLTEEILNALARTPDLLVTSRTSSFKYKNTNEEIPAIAKALGVAHVLEGSVRRGGKRLRVTAQLIRAADGFHLWSQTYDSTSGDVIAIQEDMAVKIATALKTIMDPKALVKMTRAGTRSIPAYEAYLRGLALQGKDATFKEAYTNFERARELDPVFAEAHFRASGYWAANLTPSSTFAQDVDNVERNYREYLLRINAAIKTSEGKPRQLLYRADLALNQFRLADAARDLEQYLKGAPLDFGAWASLSSIFSWMADYDSARTANVRAEKITDNTTGQQISIIFNHVWSKDFQAAADATRRAVAQYPNDADILYQAHRALLWAGAVDEARALTARLYDGESADVQKLTVKVRQSCADGDRKAAQAAAIKIFAMGNDDASTKWIAHQLLGDRQAAREDIIRFDRTSPPILLSAWLWYPYFDAQAYPHLREILKRENITRPPVAKIPFACPAAETGK